MYQCLLLAMVQLLRGGAHMGEQPAFGFFRLMWWWKALAAAGEEVLFDWCRYTRPWKKTTRLLCGNAPWLAALGLRCCCPKDVAHVKLEVTLTTRAAAYAHAFCKRVAQLAAANGRKRALTWTEPERRPGEEMRPAEPAMCLISGPSICQSAWKGNRWLRTASAVVPTSTCWKRKHGPFSSAGCLGIRSS